MKLVPEKPKVALAGMNPLIKSKLVPGRACSDTILPPRLFKKKKKIKKPKSNNISTIKYTKNKKCNAL